MDPPPQPPPSTTISTEPTSKIRLLFSYGGHIIPKPNSTNLTYSGGDTKIISLLRNSLSLSSLTSTLSRTFHSPAFVIKYQLPGEDLDSLVSVTNEEDLRNMVEEHDRIVGTARIRMFLFPARAESVGADFVGAKWFGDALDGAMEGVMQRGVSDSGLLGLNFGADVVGEKGGAGQESMVMETGSSFGSTGSSVSMTNLPSSGGIGQGEENGGYEKRTKLPSSGSIESDNNTPTATPQQYTAIYQDPNMHPISTETMTRPTLMESTPIFHNPQSNFQVLKTVQAGAHQPSNQIHHQQELQYIQTGTQHYIPQYSATPSYYPMYYPPQNQHAHNPYQQNPPYPVYYVPVGPTQAYNTPMPPHPQMHTHVPKEVVSASIPLVQVPIKQNQQQLVDISDINPTTQAVMNSEYEDEFAYNQIYKTQPSGPTLISQYQTMTTADNIK